MGTLVQQSIEGHDVSPTVVDFNGDGIADLLGGLEFRARSERETGGAIVAASMSTPPLLRMMPPMYKFKLSQNDGRIIGSRCLVLKTQWQSRFVIPRAVWFEAIEKSTDTRKLPQ